VGVTLAEGIDWRQFRPGQVVKVVGKGKTPDDAPTSLGLRETVVLSASGEGDPPMTAEQVSAALAKDAKVYAGGFTSDRYVTLTGVVAAVPAAKNDTTPTVLLAHGKDGVRCEITNWADFAAKRPKPGDTITLIGNVVNYRPTERQWSFRGLYLAQ
jgi:hypothetical protein